MAMPCAFCAIVSGAREAQTVYQDGLTIAFLDHRPLFPGHVLLVPRSHHELLADLPVDQVGPLFRNARLLSQAVQSALQAEGTFLAVNNGVSQSVPHVHVHVIPRRKGDGLKGFFWPRTRYRDSAHLEDVRSRIERAVAALAPSEPPLRGETIPP
jgi:histidine triad (HIT) family protein